MPNSDLFILCIYCQSTDYYKDIQEFRMLCTICRWITMELKRLLHISQQISWLRNTSVALLYSIFLATLTDYSSYVKSGHIMVHDYIPNTRSLSLVDINRSLDHAPTPENTVYLWRLITIPCSNLYIFVVHQEVVTKFKSFENKINTYLQ